ncbi:unnamed protein product [Moneuplotes crassus]|uniref:Uncharacterized protein n=1 Tax=Euplotes crassus TaxID=5936 RepID=A0AAD2D540_EUPCR|nr:unnamed protein product [Moneuplotes crassus]
MSEANRRSEDEFGKNLQSQVSDLDENVNDPHQITVANKFKPRNVKSRAKQKRSRNLKKLQGMIKNQGETVPSHEIEDIFTVEGFKSKKNEKNVLMNWKKFISNNGLTRTENQQASISSDTLRSGVQKSIIKSIPQDQYGNLIISRRKDYIREASQLGSKCPGNPNDPKSTRSSSNFLTINTDLLCTGRRIPSPTGLKTVKNKKNDANVQKTPLFGKEKCSRAIKRRPKSSRQFLVKNRARSSTKYRSDYFPDHRQIEAERKELVEKNKDRNCEGRSDDKVIRISVMAAMKSMPHLKPVLHANNKILLKNFNDCYEQVRNEILLTRRAGDTQKEGIYTKKDFDNMILKKERLILEKNAELFPQGKCKIALELFDKYESINAVKREPSQQSNRNYTKSISKIMKPESPRFRRKRSKAKSAARTRRYPGYKEFQRLCNEVKQGENYEIKSNDTLYLNLQNQEPKEEEGSIFDDNCPNDTQKELRQNQEVKGQKGMTERVPISKQKKIKCLLNNSLTVHSNADKEEKKENATVSDLVSGTPGEISLSMGPKLQGKIGSPENRLDTPSEQITSRESNILKKNTLRFKPPGDQKFQKSKNPLKNKLLSKRDLSREISGKNSYQKITEYSQSNLKEQKDSHKPSRQTRSHISSFEVDSGVIGVDNTGVDLVGQVPEEDIYDLIAEQEFYRAKQMKYHQLMVSRRQDHKNSRVFPGKRPISAAGGLFRAEKGYMARPLSGRATVQHRPNMRALRARKSKDKPDLEIQNGYKCMEDKSGIGQMQLKTAMKYISGQTVLAQNYLTNKMKKSRNSSGFRTQSHTNIKTVGGFVKVNPKTRLCEKDNSHKESSRSNFGVHKSSEDLAEVMYDLNKQVKFPIKNDIPINHKKAISEADNPVLRPNITKGKYRKESNEYLSKGRKVGSHNYK